MSFIKKLLNMGHHGGGGYRNDSHGRSGGGHHGGGGYRDDYSNAPAAPTKACPFCQAIVGMEARFCGQCGKNMANATCGCGATITPGAKFCGQCGASL